MRRAEINQVFIYILTILVVGLLLLMGVKYIFLLLDRKCETERVLFTKEFGAYMERYRPYETYAPVTLPLPCGKTALCLVDSRVLPDDCLSRDLQTRTEEFRDSGVPFITQSVLDCAKKNVFLGTAKRVSSGGGDTIRYTDLEPLGFEPLLQLEDSAKEYCVASSRGAVRLAFTGLGAATQAGPQRTAT